MKFGRKLSFSGYTVCLDFSLRQRLCKDRMAMADLGVVKIYDAHPTKSVNPTLVATLQPQLVTAGRLQAFWNIPEDQCEGIYYDVWEGFKLPNITKSFSKTQQFYVSSDLFSMEPYLCPEYDIELVTDTMFVDTIEYVKFKMNKPETTIFPQAEVRFISNTLVNVALDLEIRPTGPGFNELVKTNASFPEQPVVMMDLPVTTKTEFIPLRTHCDEAFFLLDTRGVKPNIYNLQLRITTGEVRQVLRPTPLRLNAADLSDGTLALSSD